MYLRHRIYDPRTAQFLSVDPLVAVTGEPYDYAADSPIDGADASGLILGIPGTPSLEEIGEGIAGWGDTITLGATKWIREELGINNVDYCSSAYQAGGFAGLVTGALIPGEDDEEVVADVWPETAEEMDEMLDIEGTRFPDGPSTPGRNKVTWSPNKDTKITFEEHPYHPEAPAFHSGPH